MKESLVVLFVFMLAYTISAQEKIVDPKAPIMEFNNTTYNFGEIIQGSEATCIFSFSNVGKNPLVIENVRSSCGCTVPSWPKEPIKRKGEGEIFVKYNTSTPKSFTKSITVYSNAKNSPIRLTVTGTVVMEGKNSKSKANIKKVDIAKPSK
jgi:Protein of unknown function (DUF1573)